MTQVAPPPTPAPAPSRPREARPEPRALTSSPGEGRARRLDPELLLVFVVALGCDLALAWYLAFHLHFISVDGLAATSNAFFVLFSRDPHLAAIGLVLNPLTSFLELPLVALRGLAPWLVSRAFAGSIETSCFGAGGAVLCDLLLRDAGLGRRLRLPLVGAWVLNPMVAFYSANGMSDIPLMFFLLLCSLILLRWLRSPRDSLLVALGVAVALATLVRYEAWAFAALVPPVLLVAERRRQQPWRRTEARLLLYGLPVALAVLFWIGANALVMHNPLDFLTSVYGNLSQTHAIGSRPEGWTAAVRTVAGEVLPLYPAYLPIAALALLMGLRRRQFWLAAALTLSTAAALLVMLYLAHRGGLDLLLRYFMTAIPSSFVLAAYALGLVRSPRRRAALGALVLGALAASTPASLAAMSNPILGGPGMEHAVVRAALADRPVTDGSYAGRIHQELGLGREVERLDRSHRLVLVDSFLGFPIVVDSPDPKLFVITSDEDFEAALNDPQAYGVGYFLVPMPSGEGRLDAVNRRYPGFWRSGDGFARRVAQLGRGAASYRWRLYRIVGPAPL